MEPSDYKFQGLNETLTINLTINDVDSLWKWQVTVSWDPNILSLIGNPVEGSFLEQAGSTIFESPPAREGRISNISNMLLSDDTGASGSGVLATFTFRIQRETVESPINLIDTSLLASGASHSQINHQTQGATVSLIIGNKPVANAIVDQNVNEDAPVVLNGSKSLVPKDENVTFTWSFFDRESQIIHGITTIYVFDIPGNYNITLTVENSLGEQSNDTVLTNVKDITPPLPIIELENTSHNQTQDINMPIVFNGSQSYDPEGGSIQAFIWNLGDGTTATGQVVGPHLYDRPGTYTVSLTVVDERGNNSASKTVTIDIIGTRNQLANLPPLATGILAVITVLAVSGSTIWVRKIKRPSKKS